MSWFTKKRIFLDYASATPILPEVKRVMNKYWSNDFYNPSAIYKEGVEVAREIEKYRVCSARLLGVSSEGIIFTASGTESNNLAILGTFEKCKETVEKPHLIISAIEHSSVRVSAEEVVCRGGEVSILEVNKEGVVSLDKLKKLLKKNTFLVSIGFANGEIGTIQPISKIGRILRKYRKEHESSYPYLHTDASQAVNYENVRIESLNCDLLTMDSSKIYGPKGVGLLAIRKGIKICSVIFGGKQERGRRAGTLSPALISGFITAFKIVQSDRERESERLEIFRKYFIESITERLPEIVINGSTNNHLPNIVSVSVPNTLSEFLLLKLDQAGVMVSVGTACSYDERESGSPVIRALSREDLATSTLRFSFGRPTIAKEVKRTAKIFCRNAKSVLK